MEASERRFLQTKSKLEALNYHQPLGIESAPLVEKLLSDLIHTTESYQQLKQQISKSSSENSSLQNQLEPLRKTNQRLIRENNQLHADLIKREETEAEKEKKWAEKMRKIENETNEVRFMNTQQNHKLRALELELGKEKKRVEELLQRHGVSYVAPTGDVEGINTRTPTMELSSTLEPHQQLQYAPTPDPTIFTDTKIEQLHQQVEALTKEKETFEEKERAFTKQIQAREREIMRLAKSVEAGSDPDRLHLENLVETSNKTIQQLRLQLEYLHEQGLPSGQEASTVHRDQRQITELNEENERLKKKLEEITSNNKTLVNELKALNQLTEGLKERQDTSRESDRKIKSEHDTLKSEVARLQQELTKQRKLAEKHDEETESMEKGFRAQLATLEARVKELTNELVATEKQRSPPPRSPELSSLREKIRNLADEKQATEDLLAKSEKEKDALLYAIGQFEIQLAEIQLAIKQLTADRDQITENYQAVSEELEEKLEVNRKLSQENSMLISRISELDTKLKQMSEKDSESKQKTTNSENQSSTIRAYATQLESLRNTNSLLEQKIITLNNQLEASKSNDNKDIIQELRDEVAKQKLELDILNDEKLDNQEQISKLKEALLMADSTLGQFEATSNTSTLHSQAYENTIRQLNTEIETQRAEIKRRELEIAEQKRVIERIDREKDNLLIQLDQKDEEVAKLASLKETEEQSRERIASSLANASAQAEKLAEQVTTKDREIFSLNSKVEALLADKVQMDTELVHLRKELDLLTKDFSSLNRDNKTLQTSLERERSEKDSLNKDVREFCARVAYPYTSSRTREQELTSCKYLEEYLKGREVEREQLLAAYQGLGNEHGQLSETLTQKQSQVDSLGIELQKRTNDMIEMERHIQELEEENNRYVMDLQAFERQTEVLSRKVAALEEQVMMLTEDREENEKELLASRGFSVQVSQSKDAVLRELAQTRLICDRQGIELQQREAKIALMSNQLEAEAKRIKDLESILKTETLKEAQVQMSSQMSASENERMKEKINKLQQQYSSSQQEILALEKAKQQLEDELSKLRRTVITSNYEREAVFNDRKETQQRTVELEKMVEDQQQVIQAMDEERARFKNFVMKYETELNKSEARLSEILSQLFTHEQTIQQLQTELKNKNDELRLYKTTDTPKYRPASRSTSPHANDNDNTANNKLKEGNRTPTPPTPFQTNNSNRTPSPKP